MNKLIHRAELFVELDSTSTPLSRGLTSRSAFQGRLFCTGRGACLALPTVLSERGTKLTGTGLGCLLDHEQG